MNRKFIFATLALILFHLLVGVCGFVSLPEAKAAGHSNQLVFRLADPHNLNEILTKYNLKNWAKIADNYIRVDVPSGTDTAALATSMSLDTKIMAVSQNKTVSFLEASNRFHFDFSQLGGAPSPATLATQWAWSKTKLNVAQNSTTGRGIKVAVLDTGVKSNHPLLAGKVIAGFDAINGVMDGSDVNGHGTFVAGIIAQVAPDAQIIPVRVLDADGTGTLDNVLTGFRFALNSGAKVINLSFSTTDDLKPLHDIIIEASNKGIVVVAASGNDATNQPYYPAAYNELVAVSATDKNDYRASFANFGNYIELSSPGVDIYSAWLDGGYAIGSGTSFSTPILAGAGAMVLQKNPGFSLNKTKQALEKAVTKFAPGCDCKGMGKGRLDFSLIK